MLSPRYMTIDNVDRLEDLDEPTMPVVIGNVKNYSGRKFIMKTDDGLSAVIYPVNLTAPYNILTMAGSIAVFNVLSRSLRQLTMVWPAEVHHRGKFVVEVDVKNIKGRRCIVVLINRAIKPECFDLYARPGIISLADSGFKWDNKAVKLILKELRAVVRRLKRNPGGWVVEEYNRLCGTRGKKARVVIDGQIEVNGTVVGVNEDGELVLLYRDIAERLHSIPDGVCYMQE